MEALRRLEARVAETGLEGEVHGDGAKLRVRTPLWPKHPYLRLSVTDDPAGAAITARFDASPWDEADFAVYTVIAVMAFSMTSTWSREGMSERFRLFMASAVPITLVLLAVFAAGHYAFRRWRQSARDRVFDAAISALGVADP